MLRGRVEEEGFTIHLEDLLSDDNDEVSEQSRSMLSTRVANYGSRLSYHATGEYVDANAPECTGLDERARADALKTIKYVVLGSIVTFGAGLEIKGFTTGFDSCTVRISSLPANALEDEIYALFTQQGIDAACLYLSHNKVLADGTREAKMVMNAEFGHALSAGLDDLEFRQSRLSFEVGTFNVPGKMGVSTGTGANVLTILCPALSVRYVIIYAAEHIARAKCQKLDGLLYNDRRLKARVTTQTPTSAFADTAFPIVKYSVRLSNLPVSTTYEEVQALAGSEVLSLIPLAPKGAPSPDIALDAIRTTVYSSGLPQSDVLFLGSEDAPDTADGTITVRARLSTWNAAKTLYDYFKCRKLPSLNDAVCQATLSSPISYTTTIPTQQHDAQRAQWNELRRISHTGDKTLSCLVRLQVPNKPLVRLRVTGSDTRAVGALKLRVESIAAGEVINGWHPRLFRRNDNTFSDRVLAETGAFVRADWRRRQIRAYGSDRAVNHARNMIETELTRLANRERKIQVPSSSVRPFLSQGLPELQELLGEENVHFDPTTRMLTTSGGDDTRHIVSRIVQHAARSSVAVPHHIYDTCPICFEVVSAPVRLSCGHAHCSTCLRHLVTSAADSDKFPLVCMGDAAQCKAPIPLPVLERFLPRPALARLFDVSFYAYVAQNPREVRYCRTPDCNQIYRVAQPDISRPTPIQCPACLTMVCPGCHQDEHQEMTCEEHRVHSNPAEQERLVDEWVASQGDRVKRCPQCKVPIEKMEGCNHMECKCGAHVCWTCLGVFAAHDIYTHMRTEHGGIHDFERAVFNIERPVDPQLQVNVETVQDEDEPDHINVPPHIQHMVLQRALNPPIDPEREARAFRRRGFYPQPYAENNQLRERFLAAEAERQLAAARQQNRQSNCAVM